MKEHVRVLGVDDGPFKFSDRTVPIVGVVMRGGYMDGIMTSEVEVDGADATQRVIDMVERSKYKEQIRVIMLDGIALGGFNVVDMSKLHNVTEIPVISITRDAPDFDAMKEVLKKKFDDWELRWELVSRGKLLVVDTEHKPIHIKAVGINEKDAKEVIGHSIVRGALPEAIRVAHIVATAMAKGESKGKA